MDFIYKFSTCPTQSSSSFRVFYSEFNVAIKRKIIKFLLPVMLCSSLLLKSGTWSKLSSVKICNLTRDLQSIEGCVKTCHLNFDPVSPGNDIRMNRSQLPYKRPLPRVSTFVLFFNVSVSRINTA